MANHLISVLGKGQSVQNPQLGRKYRETFYYFPDTDISVKTAFVGNAIIELLGKSITHFHLLGTSGSMWDVLFESLINEDSLELISSWEKLAEKSAANEVTDADLHTIRKLYEEKTGIRVFCYILPTGLTDTEVNGIFNKIISLEAIKAGDTVSVDITHGFRYQPMFLMMGLEFFVNIKGVKTASVYYGALESAADYLPADHTGKGNLKGIPKDQIPASRQGEYLPLAPLMTFNQLPGFYSAINAAWYFNRTGSTQLLLENPMIKLDQRFIKLLRDFDFRIQSALLKGIRTAAFNIKREIEDASQKSGDWFTSVMLNMIKLLPEKLVKTKDDYNAISIVAGMYIESGRYDNASLALWDCIIGFFASGYGLNESERKNYTKISSLILQINKSSFIGNEISVIKKLKKLRDKFAHAKGMDLQFEEVAAIMNSSLMAVKKVINDPGIIEKLKARYPIGKFNEKKKTKKNKKSNESVKPE